MKNRTNSVEPDLANELVAGFVAVVKGAKKTDYISRYEEALPWCDCPRSTSERRSDYQEKLRNLKSATRNQPRKSGRCECP